MKNYILLSVACVCSLLSYSQTIFFHEDFELPSGADSVTSAGNPGWNINTSLGFMGNQSMHSGIMQSDTSILITNSFSTAGSSYVMLTFHTIAKVSFFDAGFIEVSTDSLIWTQLCSWNSIYLGSGNFGPAPGCKFTSICYADWDPSNDTTTPNNNWWKYEAFDVSLLLANQPSVWVRFKLFDGNNTGSSGNYGWLIDNIIINDNPSSFYSISGEIYLDYNASGNRDPGEPSVPNQPVRILPYSIFSYTNTSGFYLQPVQPGNYQVNYQAPPNWQISSLPLTYNLTLSTSSINNVDFGLTPDSLIHKVTGLSTSGIPSCFDKLNYYLKYTNTGTFFPDSIRVIFNSDPNLTFSFSNPPPDQINSNTYIWTLPGILPLHSSNILLQMNVPLPAGSSISSLINIETLDNAGNTLASDMDTMPATVWCSWDPNDKSVNPPGVQAQNYTMIGEEFEYMIRFQNTGNDTAFKVVIVDTLSIYLDVSTFDISSFSHDLTSVEINNDVVTFTFDNIMLPDSIVDEPNSHGYIVYTIDHLSNIADSSEVKNTAYIYFDLNPSVVTNTTLNTMVSQLPVSVPGILQDESIKLYPNPANKFLTLAGAKVSSEYYIADLSGRIVKSGKITGENGIINVEAIKAGAYILKLQSEERIYSIKFFKIE